MCNRKLKHDYATIHQRNLNGETIKNISKDTGIHIQSIYTHFQKNGWKFNEEIPIRKSGHFVDDNYLDNIDTEDKSYFLGWLLSDGYVIKNRISLKLKQDDEYIIREMFNKFSSGYKFSTYKNSKSLSVSSTKLTVALEKLGCVERKTLMGFSLPDIPKNLFRHFIRGYFDGDGSVGIRSARPNQMQISICSIDENFLIELKNKLFEFNILSSIYKEKRNGKELLRPDKTFNTDNIDMFRLVLNTHKEKLRFYEFIYNDCTIKLTRKYEKYTNYFLNTIKTLENKNSKIIQHVDEKIIINYDLITDKIFNMYDEVDEEYVMNLYKQGNCEYKIHKEMKVGRSVIKNILIKNGLI